MTQHLSYRKWLRQLCLLACTPYPATPETPLLWQVRGVRYRVLPLGEHRAVCRALLGRLPTEQPERAMLALLQINAHLGDEASPVRLGFDASEEQLCLHFDLAMAQTPPAAALELMARFSDVTQSWRDARLLA